MMIRDERPIETKGRHDVIVAGGGVAGVAAALAAARQGRSVLLIEKSVVLGGLATIGLISWYEPLCDGRGTQMIGGISEELLRLAIRYGPDDLPNEWKNSPPKDPTRRRYATHFSPTLFAMALDELLVGAGVTLLLDALITCPIMEAGRCAGLLVEHKGGRAFYPATMIVDATGDADVLHRAGAPCIEGCNYLSFFSHWASTEEAKKAADDGNILHLRKWKTAGSDLYGNGHPDGMKYFTGVTGEEITEFVLDGRRLLFDKIREDGRFERDILTLPTMAQFRTTRHLVGEYDLSGRDKEIRFDDSIGRAGDFRKPGDRYEIPYRCLVHRDFPNLLAAGRIVSASGDGWEVTRVIPVAALTGQAAGTAAALLAAGQTAATDIDLKTLQAHLEKAGVLLHI